MYLFHIILSFAAITNGARILGIVPFPSYSHQTAFWPIWKELSRRGHQVTVIIGDPINDPSLTNLTEIDVHTVYDTIKSMYNKMGELNPVTTITMFSKHMALAAQNVLNNREVKELIKSGEESRIGFDVVLVESFFPEFLIFGEIYKCPTIMVSSFDTLSYIHRSIGNPVHPIATGNFCLPFFRDMSFKERLISIMFYLFEWFYYYLIHIPRSNGIIKRNFGDESPGVLDLLNKVSLTFLNVHPVLYGAKLTGPSTMYSGGMTHIRDPKPLPKDLQNFLDAGKEGVVYLSLGTNMKSVNLDAQRRKAIEEAVRDLPYKVLWKYEADNYPNLPNVEFIKWAPQQDILRHKNVKVFVTQGGLQSLEEAIYNHVPVVALPFFGDQLYNAKKVEEEAIGKVIYHMEYGLDGGILRDAIIEVFTNRSYRQNSERLANLMLDEPMRGAEKVAWWTEYVIRHKGAKYFRHHSLDIPWYQYLLLDVIGFTFIVVLTAIIIFKHVSKAVKRFVNLSIMKNKTE